MSTRSGTAAKSLTAGRPATGAIEDRPGVVARGVSAAARALDTEGPAPPPGAVTATPEGAGAVAAVVAGRLAQPETITNATSVAVRPMAADLTMRFSFGEPFEVTSDRCSQGGEGARSSPFRAGDP